MIEMVLVEKTDGDYDTPLRTLALVDLDDTSPNRYFSNIICWNTYGAYWGVDWRERMKVLKRKE